MQYVRRTYILLCVCGCVCQAIWVRTINKGDKLKFSADSQIVELASLPAVVTSSIYYLKQKHFIIINALSNVMSILLCTFALLQSLHSLWQLWVQMQSAEVFIRHQLCHEGRME